MEVGGLEHQASSYSKLAPWLHDSMCLGKWDFLISVGLRAQTQSLDWQGYRAQGNQVRSPCVPGDAAKSCYFFAHI